MKGFPIFSFVSLLGFQLKNQFTFRVISDCLTCYIKINHLIKNISTKCRPLKARSLKNIFVKFELSLLIWMYVYFTIAST
jgi:hypothetical protein